MMKKYLVMLSAFAVTALMFGCTETGGGGGGGTDDPKTKIEVADASYYGEKLGKGAGYYSITFQEKEENTGKVVSTTRLDFFSNVATNLKKIEPQSGDYNMVAKDAAAADKKGNYFVAASVDDAEGTVHADGVEPMIVTGGKFNLNISVGGYFVTVNLKAGDNDINFNYSGVINFEDKSEAPPRDEIVADLARIDYVGEYYESSTRLGVVSLIMASSKTLDEQILVRITVPYPSDPDAIEVPVGTFNVEAIPNSGGKIIGGVWDSSKGALYSWEVKMVEIDGVNYFGGGVCINDGSITITKAAGADKYNISADFSGVKYDSAAKPGSKVSGVKYTMENITLGVSDLTNPSTTLEDDVNVTNLKNIFVDIEPFSLDDETASILLWRLVMTEEGMNVTSHSSTNELYLAGDGNLIGLQVIVDGSGNNKTEFPVGATYKMAKDYNAYTGTLLPAVSGNDTVDILGVTSGTWYAVAGYNDEGKRDMIGGAGSMPNKGSLKTSVSGDNVTFEVEMYDKKGHKVTGSCTAEMKTVAEATRSNSRMYVPMTSVINMLYSGSLNLQK